MALDPTRQAAVVADVRRRWGWNQTEQHLRGDGTITVLCFTDGVCKRDTTVFRNGVATEELVKA